MESAVNSGVLIRIRGTQFSAATFIRGTIRHCQSHHHDHGHAAIGGQVLTGSSGRSGGATNDYRQIAVGRWRHQRVPGTAHFGFETRWEGTSGISLGQRGEDARQVLKPVELRKVDMGTEMNCGIA
jgi:hypothetical protein